MLNIIKRNYDEKRGVLNLIFVFRKYLYDEGFITPEQLGNWRIQWLSSKEFYDSTHRYELRRQFQKSSPIFDGGIVNKVYIDNKFIMTIFEDLEHIFAGFEEYARNHGYKIESLEEDLQSDFDKYYSDMDQDDFLTLVALDPTYNGNKKMTDSKGKYARWIIDRFNQGDISEADFGHVKDCLARFDSHKDRLENKDINAYKSLEELDSVLNASDENRTANQIDKDNKKAMHNAEFENDLVLETANWKVYVPSSYENSLAIAHQGDDEDHYCEWCTASTDSDYYYKYYKNTFGGDYYILINKNDIHDKYQFHFESNQFMDVDDYAIDLNDFLKENSELKDFFREKQKANIIKEIKNTPEITLDGENIKVTLELNSMLDEWDNKELRDWTQEFIIDDFYTFYRMYYDWINSKYALSILKQWKDDILNNQYIVKRLDELNLTFDELCAIVGDEDYFIEDIDTDEIRNTVIHAAIESNISGSISQCWDDLQYSLKNVGEYLGTITNTNYYDSRNASMEVSTTVDKLIEFLNDYANQDELLDNGLIENIYKVLMQDFDFSEPYYGWNDWDKDAFIDYLSENL